MKMALWVDAFGQRYKAPAGNFTPGQISDTGSRLIRYIEGSACQSSTN